MRVSSLMKLRNILNLEPGEEAEIRKFTVDSREIRPGDLYCALPGANVHGEEFVDEAFQKGAAFALVSSSYAGKQKNILRVPDVLAALQTAARHIFFEHRPKHVIAITGSLGKTTTKEFLSTLLEGFCTIFKTPGNANSQIGLPISILNDFFDQEMAILEMGMTAPGEIASLVSITPPDIALLTKVSLVHAAHFDSLEAIQEAKSEIFLHPRTAIGIYPKELELGSKGKCQKYTFGLNGDFSLVKNQGWHFISGGESWLIESLPFNEPHFIHNLTGALSAAFLLNADRRSVIKKIPQLVLPEKRMQRRKKKGVLFIDDSYNAAPESVIAALKSLPERVCGKKKVAVLGAMHDLGVFSDECHRKVGEEALLLVDHLVCYGKIAAPLAAVWKEAGRPCVHCDDHAEIVKHLQKILEPGDLVLLKGSNSTKMWTIVDNYA